MPRYTYKCEECDAVKEVSHGMNEKPVILCEEDGCGGKLFKTIPKTLNFVLKGANWSGKNAKEKYYRTKRNREMGRKMAKSHDIPQISPNYEGEVCSSWDEAKKLAKANGVNMTRYEKQVDNLKKQQNKVEQKRNNLLKGEG